MFKRVMLAAAFAFAVGACDEGGKEASKPASAPSLSAAAAKKEADAKAAAEKREADRAAEMKALSVYPDQPTWTAACIESNKDNIPKEVCDCAGKAVVSTLGAQALYSWVWEGYIQRSPAAQARAINYFNKNGVSDELRAKYLKAVTACYTN